MAAQQPSRSSTHTYPNKIEKKDEKKSCLRRHHILQTFSTKFTYIQASFSELAQSALNQSLMLCFFLSGRSSVISGVIHPGFIFCVIFFGPDNLAIRCSNVPFLSFFLSFFLFFFLVKSWTFFLCVLMRFLWHPSYCLAIVSSESSWNSATYRDLSITCKDKQLFN